MKSVSENIYALILASLLGACGTLHTIDYGLSGTGSRVSENSTSAAAQTLVAIPHRRGFPDGVMYEDSDIVAGWDASTRLGILLTLQNKTDEPMDILWDESWVDDGSTKEAIVCESLRRGDTYALCEKSTREIIPARTTVAASEVLGIFAHPRSHVSWQRFTHSKEGFWSPVKRLFVDPSPVVDAQTELQMWEELAKRALGKTMQVFLATSIGRQKVTYVFTLSVMDARARSSLCFLNC